ncbi:MAG: hypothetical protein NZ108_01220, partial [Bacteroidia bacterium]|nr:hypothetical protein [Bacteroidia bacterium]
IFTIAWLSYGVFKTLKFIRFRKVPDAILSIFAITVASYFKPICLLVIPIFLTSGILFLVIEKKWAFFLWLIVLPFALLFPWYLRNYSIIGRFTFSTVGDISMFYGRLGAIEAMKRGFPVDEHHAILAGDLFITESVGQTIFKQYIEDYPTHETEVLSPNCTRISLLSLVQNPVHTLRLLFTAVLQMYQGVGYRTAEHLTGSRFYAFVTATIQAIVLLFFALSLLFYFSNWTETHFVHHWAFGIILLLVIGGSTAWADGRYRFIADCLLTLQTASILSRIGEYLSLTTSETN